MKKLFPLVLFLLSIAVHSFAQTAPQTAPIYLGKRATDPSSCVRVTDYYYNTTISANKTCTVRGTPGTWSSSGGSSSTVGTYRVKANTFTGSDLGAKINAAEA